MQHRWNVVLFNRRAIHICKEWPVFHDDPVQRGCRRRGGLASVRPGSGSRGTSGATNALATSRFQNRDIASLEPAVA